MGHDPRIANPTATRTGFAWAGKPWCTGGHPLRAGQPRPLEDGVVRCTARAHRGGAECGRHLYLARLTLGGSSLPLHEGVVLWFTVELTDEQRTRLTTEILHPLERLALLGVLLPGAADDLPRHLGAA